MAACGGFSYGDVLWGGRRWAKSILFNARAREELLRFFALSGTFGLGMHGCQMMSNLHDLIPGAEHWPHFVRNRSGAVEALVSLLECSALAQSVLRRMAGSRSPVTTAHGRATRVPRSRASNAAQAVRHAAVRRASGRATERYPFNPNGSPRVSRMTTPDGRFSILMPHPERVFRTGCRCPGIRTVGPRTRRGCGCSRNARVWLG